MADLLCSVVDGADVITVGADLDVYTAPSLREATTDPALLARARLVIDLSATTFMDTWGVAAIVGALRRIRESDGAMGVVCSSESLLRLIRLHRLERLLSVYDTVDEAVTAVKEGSDA